MGTPAIQLRAPRKPVVTVHFNELNQLRKCLHCGVAVCLMKHLPAHTEDFFFLNGLSSMLVKSSGLFCFLSFPLKLQVEKGLVNPKTQEQAWLHSSQHLVLKHGCGSIHVIPGARSNS